MAVGHQVHAEVELLLGFHGDHRCTHDFAYRGGGGRAALEDQFARIVPFTDDTHYLAALDYRQRTDVFLRQQFQGVEHRVIRADGVDGLVLGLGLEDLFDGLHTGLCG